MDVDNLNIQRVKHLTIYLQNKELKVSPKDVTPETTLNEYLREVSMLRGTKAMCLEGGCGTCIVAVTKMHPITKKSQTIAVNSCLVSLYSCHGWEIHTIEGIGNKLIGHHPLQKKLAEYNGTQCGFCSPGMVMTMFALSESKQNFTMSDVEDTFSGNLCRCTGYRPILSAFKSMASDADPALIGQSFMPNDIEDLKICQKNKNLCKQSCDGCPSKDKIMQFGAPEDDLWFRVYRFDDLTKLVKQYKDRRYMLVGGNTARGVFKPPEPYEVFIDITQVEELVKHSITDEEIKLGANVSLAEIIEIFEKVSKERRNFDYLKQAAVHVNLVANDSVRNVGTISGNLILKHTHQEFPSDIFLLLETIDAKLTIHNVNDNSDAIFSLRDFLQLDMVGRIIKTISLPALDPNEYIFHSYKIMKRAQNTHAMVNAGYLIKVDTDRKVKSARIFMGNLTTKYTYATEVSNYLVGKPLFDNGTIQGVCNILDRTLNPVPNPPDPSPEYRKALAIALFYKFILTKAPPDLVSPKHKSGARMITLDRPISTGLQDFETNKSMYPITEPILKVEALLQTSGETLYVFDRPPAPGQLYAAFVEANTRPLNTIRNVDTSEAMKLPGVVAFIDKNDIPGKNTYTPKESLYKLAEEELFCSGSVRYHHQPIGVIVATTQKIANDAADLVKVTYDTSTEKPYITNREILKDKKLDRITNEVFVPEKSTGTDQKYKIHGKFDIGPQFHFHMELQICAMELREDGYNMYAGTQWMDLCQIAAAKALKIPEHKIHVEVRRLGGAFGAKISKAALTSTACAVASHKLKKPVKMWVQLERNMDIYGKRYPISADFEAAINSKGVVQTWKNTFYSNYGSYFNEPTAYMALGNLESVYNTDTWFLSCNHCITESPPHTWTRAPGSTEGSAMTESIMEHLSIVSGIDPYDLRYINLHKKMDLIKHLMEEIKTWADYSARQKAVEDFNKVNRWIKKGLTIMPVKFEFLNISAIFNCFISIYSVDGTVSVMHGGIEMGQGINTKTVQAVAYLLGITVDMVTVHPSNTMTNPNSLFTGSSLGTEGVLAAAIKACNTLNERLAPIKQKMQGAKWEEIVNAAFNEGVNLTATGHCYPPKDFKEYNVLGVGVAEVEVDVLTGLFQIIRMDIIQDVGSSMNPNIDIGQIEGAITMGLGLWMFEEIVLDKDGKVLTNRTWNYTPPGAKDIPIDFRIRIEKNNPNPAGVFNSKAISEAPLLLAFSVPMAVRRAIASARQEAQPDSYKWVAVDGPTSQEYIFMSCLNNFKQYTL